MEKENVTGELREHTEQYRDRLLEQLEQIKHLQGTVDTRDAELEAAKRHSVAGARPHSTSGARPDKAHRGVARPGLV